MLYFAYGANLDPETLAARGVTFSRLCTGRVKNARLVFHKPGHDGTGKADLQDDRGGYVEGVIYDVADAALDNLDVYEGVDKGHYRRMRVTVQTSRGELECVAYRAAKFKTGLKPSRTYLDAMLRGADYHDLSPGYRNFLSSHTTMEEADRK